MLKRNTQYYKSLEKERKDSTASRKRNERAALVLIESNFKGWRWSCGIGYTFFTLVTLGYLLHTLLASGFYSELSPWIVIGVIGVSDVLCGMSLAFIITKKKWRITSGSHIIRWVLGVLSLAVAVLSMLETGVLYCFWISIAILLLVVVLQLVISFGNRDSNHMWKIVLAVAIVISVGITACDVAIADEFGEDRVVVTSPFSRTVVYQREGDEARVDKVMLNLNDAFGIPVRDDVVPLEGFVFFDDNAEYLKVSSVGPKAFHGVGAVSKIYLPETIHTISGGAFDSSSVTEITVGSPTVHIGDIFTNSSVTDLVLVSRTVAELYFEVFPDNLTIHVPQDLMDEYVARYPAYAPYIVPSILNGSFYVTVSVEAPDVASTSHKEQLESFEWYVLDGAESNTVELPFAALINEHDRYGSHRVIELDGETYRLLLLRADGEELAAEASFIPTSNTRVRGVWSRSHYVYVDLSEIGGGLTLLDEIDPRSDEYIPDFGAASSLIPSGYDVEGWYDNISLDGEAVTSITDYTRDYTLYPKLILQSPELSATDYTLEYDGAGHTLSVSFTHAASVTVQSIDWLKNGEMLILSEGSTYPSVRFTSDSGVYTATITVGDTYGRTASASIDIPVTITPAPVYVAAEAKESVYLEAMKPLTYTWSSPVEGASVSGELYCNIDGGAGVYEIEKGSLTTAPDFAIVYQPAVYTVTKAEAIISLSSVIRDYTYTGLLQTVGGATLNHTESALVYSDNTFTTVAEGNGRTVTVFAPESANYKSTSATFTISVSPMKVAIPTFQTAQEYTGSVIVALGNSEYYTVTGGSATNRGNYTATLTLTDTDNCVWEDGDFSGTIEWSIL